MSGFADTLRLAVRFSVREMRGGLSGFLIFITCIGILFLVAVALLDETWPTLWWLSVRIGAPSCSTLIPGALLVVPANEKV